MAKKLDDGIHLRADWFKFTTVLQKRLVKALFIIFNVKDEKK